MKIVLLSGGSGQRLWPLSNDSRSKQFLKVLRNPQCGLESMVQRVWRQLIAVNLAHVTVIATGAPHAEIIQNQLGLDIPMIIEPHRRDTFPAIALSVSYLYSIEKMNLNEVICVLPVDPYTEDQFFERMKELENVIHESGAELALIGVKPTHPSGKYGYIVPEKNADMNVLPYLKVKHFKEKPGIHQVKKLIRKNALWNCGVYAFKLKFFIDLIIEKGWPTEYDELIKHFNQLPKTSFDYEVAEKANHLVVLPYNGFWKDLGTWNTLTEEIDIPVIGKGKLSKDSINTHLINELNVPIAVLGLSNVIVAASADGILVANKSTAPRLKELIDEVKQRPMYEEKRWGSYYVLDYAKFVNGSQVLTKRIRVTAGRNLSYQLHFKRTEVWTIISGEGEFVLNDQFSSVEPGDVLKIPSGGLHAVKAITDLEFIEVQTGSELVEEDIVRICMTWEEIEKRKEGEWDEKDLGS